MDFSKMQIQVKTIKETLLSYHIEPWAEVFGFEYDKDDLAPIEPKSCLPDPQEGVYRTEFDKKYSKPKPNPYKGVNENDGKYIFEFTEPIWPNDRAHFNPRFSSTQGQINIYPPYIYSTFKISPANYDPDWINAINELEAIITMGDMNGVYKKEGAVNTNGCLFYLSFLKSQVIILLSNAACVQNARLKEGAISIENLGVYCPCYDFADYIRPAILLDLNAIRNFATKEKKDLKELYKHTLLKLFAYAYQDPTNTVDENGAFVKNKWDSSFSFDESNAVNFINTYFSC